MDLATPASSHNRDRLFHDRSLGGNRYLTAAVDCPIGGVCLLLALRPVRRAMAQAGAWRAD